MSALGTTVEASYKRGAEGYQAEQRKVAGFGRFLMLTSLTNITIALLGVLSGIWCARLLGAAGRGELAAIQTIPMWLSWLMIGLPDSLAYFSAREPARARQWVATTMLAGAISCVPMLVAGYFLLPVVLQEQTAVTIHAAKSYLFFILPIGVLVNLPVFALIGLNDSVFYNLMRLLWPLLWNAAILFAWGTGLTDPVRLSQIYLVLMWLLVPIIVQIIRRRIPGTFRPDLTRIRPATTYGLSAAIGNVPVTMNLRLDQMVMPGLLPPHMLGLYVVGVAWSNAFSPLILALSTAIVPRVAGENSNEKRKQMVAQSIRLGGVWALLLAGLIALSSPLVIPFLFGKEYAEAVPCTIILAIAAVPAGINQLLAANAKSLGNPRLIFVAEGAGLIVTIIALWLLLQPWQLIGAATASLLSYVVTLIMFVWLITRHTGLSVRELLIIRGEDWRSLLLRLQSWWMSVRKVRKSARNCSRVFG